MSRHRTHADDLDTYLAQIAAPSPESPPAPVPAPRSVDGPHTTHSLPRGHRPSRSSFAGEDEPAAVRRTSVPPVPPPRASSTRRQPDTAVTIAPEVEPSRTAERRVPTAPARARRSETRAAARREARQERAAARRGGQRRPSGRVAGFVVGCALALVVAPGTFASLGEEGGRDTGVVVADWAASAASVPLSTDSVVAGAGGMVLAPADLGSRPTSGRAWDNLLAAANDRSGGVALADQDSTFPARTLAAALVHARTGNTAYRDQVVSVLRSLPKASLSGARVLSLARQLGGYAAAADVIGYRDPAFTAWIRDMRTRDVGGHGRWTTITGTSEDSANNWGTWAMASRVAISAYLGDTADLRRAATVFRGFTGDRAAYAGFRPTSDYDAGWTCGGTYVPINPAGCAHDGALVEDISRSAGSAGSVDATGLTYSWEALGGATLTARILHNAGYPDVWHWSNDALLRAARFLDAHGGYAPRHRVNQYIPHEINTAYGVDLGPVAAAGHGRQFGFTDWLGM